MDTAITDRSKAAVARRVAESHYLINPTITDIYRLVSPTLEDDEREPVKLLEVNEATIPAGILPIGFGADPPSGLYYPCTIVEVTPDEMKQIEGRELQLPFDWRIGERYSRPD